MVSTDGMRLIGSYQASGAKDDHSLQYQPHLGEVVPSERNLIITLR